MTVKEARQEKINAELAITEILSKLQKKTGCRVEDVTIIMSATVFLSDISNVRIEMSL